MWRIGELKKTRSDYVNLFLVKLIIEKEFISFVAFGAFPEYFNVMYEFNNYVHKSVYPSHVNKSAWCPNKIPSSLLL